VKKSSSSQQSAELELDRYGIEVTSVKIYLYNGYRYTSASDAIAAAKRGVRS